MREMREAAANEIRRAVINRMPGCLRNCVNKEFLMGGPSNPYGSLNNHGGPPPLAANPALNNHAAAMAAMLSLSPLAGAAGATSVGLSLPPGLLGAAANFAQSANLGGAGNSVGANNGNLSGPHGGAGGAGGILTNSSGGTTSIPSLLPPHPGGPNPHFSQSALAGAYPPFLAPNFAGIPGLAGQQPGNQGPPPPVPPQSSQPPAQQQNPNQQQNQAPPQAPPPSQQQSQSGPPSQQSLPSSNQQSGISRTGNSPAPPNGSGSAPGGITNAPKVTSTGPTAPGGNGSQPACSPAPIESAPGALHG